MRPLIFDDTALVGMFQPNTGVDAAWHWARMEGVTVFLPATAVAVANFRVCESDNVWAGLHGPNVRLLDLTVEEAPEVGRLSADLVIGHVSTVASKTGATVVTARPLDYGPMIRTWEIRPF